MWVIARPEINMLRDWSIQSYSVQLSQREGEQQKACSREYAFRETVPLVCLFVRLFHFASWCLHLCGMSLLFILTNLFIECNSTQRRHLHSLINGAIVMLALSLLVNNEDDIIINEQLDYHHSIHIIVMLIDIIFCCV